MARFGGFPFGGFGGFPGHGFGEEEPAEKDFKLYEGLNYSIVVYYVQNWIKI